MTERDVIAGVLKVGVEPQQPPRDLRGDGGGTWLILGDGR